MSKEPQETTKAEPEKESKSSKGGLIFWAILLVALIGAAAWPRTRVYGYQWVMVVGNFKMRSWAFDKIAGLDPEIATPAMIVALGDEDLGIQDRAVEKIKNTDKALTLEPLIGALDNKDWLTRCYASDLLAERGQELPDNAVEGIIKACDDENEPVRQSAIRALCQIPKFDDRRFEIFSKAAEDKAFEARGTAMTGLSGLTKMSDKVRPILMTHITDDHSMVREYALTGLVNLDAVNKKPFPLETVLRCAADDNVDVRITSIRYLGEAGKNSPEVIKALQNNLDSDSEQLRLLSMIILGNYGRKTPEIRAQVLKMTNSDPSKLVRLQGILNLGTLGAEEPDVIDAINTAVNDDAQEIRQQAIGLIGNREVREDADLRRLFKILETDKELVVRQTALRTIYKMKWPKKQLERANAIAAKDISDSTRKLARDLASGKEKVPAEKPSSDKQAPENQSPNK